MAISNHRIKSVDEKLVTFTYKDNKTGAQSKEMTLSLEEFIRRFSQHFLPKGIVEICPGGVPHYGILSSTWKRAKLPEFQEKLKKSKPKPKKKLRV